MDLISFDMMLMPHVDLKEFDSAHRKEHKSLLQ